MIAGKHIFFSQLRRRSFHDLHGPISLTLIIICLVLASCSGTRRLPEGELLYTGADIELETTENINKRRISNVAQRAVLPEPNRSFLGIRPGLWLYMLPGEEPETRIGKWLKSKGSPPVLLSSVRPSATSSFIEAELFNIGIFEVSTAFETVEKKRTAKIVYTSNVHRPYRIGEMSYDIADDSISKLIIADKENSVIKPGDDYNLRLLRGERIRIDAMLKNQGYFYFNPEYLLFHADTSSLDRTVSFTLTLMDNVPDNALREYRINNVFIDQDYTLSGIEDSINQKYASHYHDFLFAGRLSDLNIKPGVILESIYLRKGEIYSRRNHSITLNRLMSMGNFKFVQIKFAESDTTAEGFLDVRILMTTMTTRTFRAEMDLVSKSNDFTGPRLNANLQNRNLFRGSELLNFNLAGSYETQLGGADNNLYSFSFNPQIELIIPRFITPFNIRGVRSIYTPKTHIALSYQFLKRVKYFDMNTLQFNYGFNWKESIRIEHELQPVNVSYTAISNQSPEFRGLLDTNPFLKRSYEEMFIAGAKYSFTYNDQLAPAVKRQYYLYVTAETAGNIFSLISSPGRETALVENPAKIAGSVYSQFARVSLDTRFYQNFRNTNKLALRFVTGLARPYGNSAVMPYTRQFFSGGPNSVRAFPINSVGPGDFFQDSDTRGFLQLGGDVKLEFNSEYRFPIFSIIKGALFIDAGNVWQLKSNPSNTGSPFSFSGFINELAIGTGAGIRLDVNFFVLRFDLATPIRKPWLTEGNRWVLSEIDFTNSSWRKDNLVLNVAIGYPF